MQVDSTLHSRHHREIVNNETPFGQPLGSLIPLYVPMTGHVEEGISCVSARLFRVHLRCPTSLKYVAALMEQTSNIVSNFAWNALAYPGKPYDAGTLCVSEDTPVRTP